MHGQSAYGYAKRSMSTNATSEAVADSALEAPPQHASQITPQTESTPSGSQRSSAREAEPSSSSSSSSSSASRSRSSFGNRQKTIETRLSSFPSTSKLPSSTKLSAKQAGKLPAGNVDRPTHYDELETAVLKGIPHLFDLSTSRSSVKLEHYKRAVHGASAILRQQSSTHRKWDNAQTALIIAPLDAHVRVDVRKGASDSRPPDCRSAFGLSELATSIMALKSDATPIDICTSMIATGVSIGDVYITTLGWYESNKAFEQLRKQDGQPQSQYVEDMRNYLQLTLEAICEEVAQVLRLGQRLTTKSVLKSQDLDVLQRYLSAVASYKVILMTLEEGGIYQNAYLQPIIKLLLLTPKSPTIHPSETSSSLAMDVAAVSGKAATLQEAIKTHGEAYNRAHGALESLLELFINQSEKIKSAPWRSDFITEPPPDISSSRDASQKSKRRLQAAGSRWSLRPDVANSGSDSQASTEARAIGEPSTTRIAQDMPSLLLLLRYAYQHLASFRAANAFYECVVAPALRKAANRNDEAVRQDTLVHQEYCDITRLRGGSLLRQNKEVDKLILTIITRLSDEEDRNALKAGVDTDTLRAWREEKVYGVSMWQPQTLLRSESVSNAVLTAILSHWVATSKFDWTRYFIHHFMSLRAHVRTREESTLDSSASKHLDQDAPDVAQGTSSARLAKWVSSSELLVVMLNAASKAGMISLAEHLWIAAKREESRAAWILPVQAYTIMFQLQERQAVKELNEARYGKVRTYSWTSTGQQGKAIVDNRLAVSEQMVRLDSGNESGTESESGDLGRTNSRSASQYRNDARPAWAKAWDIYQQLAEHTQTGRILPDAVMFNNLLDVLLLTHKRCSLRGNPDLESEGEAREVMRRLAFLRRDLLNAGLPVSSSLRSIVHPHPTGLLQYHRSRSPMAFHSKRYTLRNQHGQLNPRIDGQTEWTTLMASKSLRALPSRAERMTKLPTRYRTKQEGFGKWDSVVEIQRRLVFLQGAKERDKPTSRRHVISWKRHRKEHDLHSKRLVELS